jgi:hypothetical protein
MSFEPQSFSMYIGFRCARDIQKVEEEKTVNESENVKTK